MRSKRTLAFDVDGCIITEIGWDWWNYLRLRYILKPEYVHLKYNWLDTHLPYNLTELFDFSDEKLDGFEFWHNSKLYDEYRPREDAMEYVKKLHEEGNDIIFISRVIGDQSLSKINFINKWFPYAKACILTGEKHYVRCDVLVDDCVANLNRMPEDVDCYLFRDDFYQSEVPERKMKKVYNFEELYSILK